MDTKLTQEKTATPTKILEIETCFYCGEIVASICSEQYSLESMEHEKRVLMERIAALKSKRPTP